MAKPKNKTIRPPWVKEPEKWACPQCDSRNLDGREGSVWTCLDCGCRKSFELFDTYGRSEGRKREMRKPKVDIELRSAEGKRS